MRHTLRAGKSQIKRQTPGFGAWRSRTLTPRDGSRMMRAARMARIDAFVRKLREHPG